MQRPCIEPRRDKFRLNLVPCLHYRTANYWPDPGARLRISSTRTLPDGAGVPGPSLAGRLRLLRRKYQRLAAAWEVPCGVYPVPENPWLPIIEDLNAMLEPYAAEAIAR